MTAYLFFDIDGTLVSRTEGLIPGAAEAIRNTRLKGNRCFLCTGRHLGSLRLADGVERDGIVFCNGAGVFLDGKVIHTSPVPAELVEKTVSLAEKMEGMYSLQSVFRTFKNEREIARMRAQQPADPRFDTFEDMMQSFGASELSAYEGQDILKIDIGFKAPSVMNEFLALLDPALSFTAGAGTNVNLGRKAGEITRADVNKAAGIRRMMEAVHGDMRSTYAFGDSSNDLEMLKECAYGIAMGNASEEVKRSADYVTDDILDDGIYHALMHFNLL